LTKQLLVKSSELDGRNIEQMFRPFLLADFAFYQGVEKSYTQRFLTPQFHQERE